MKRVNNSGTVFKLTDTKRRKPWAAVMSYRDEDGFRHKKLLGTFETKLEATKALNAFIVSPINIRNAMMTFEQVFQIFFEEYSKHCSKSTARLRMISFRQAAPLHSLVFSEIRAMDLQKFLDGMEKGTPTIMAMRSMFGSLWRFGVSNEYCNRDVTLSLKVPKRDENTNSRPHVPYTEDEIALLWEHEEEDPAAIQLMLIYCGCRISELIDLHTADIDIENQCFTIRQAKTKAGVRTVPIASKVLPLWKRFLDRHADRLIVSEYGNAIQYQRVRTYWDDFNRKIGIDRMPHDCRHTAISRMTAAGVDTRTIKKIVGHRSGDVTEDVYTHIPFEKMLEAVNLI